MLNYTDLMTSSLENLRRALTSLSLDEFVIKTLEGLMQIERQEYLSKAKDIQEKGNGYYGRAFRSLRRNSLTINIPRTRSGLFSPLTMELIKKNREDIDDLCLTLTKKGMTTRDISSILEEFFGERMSHTSINKMAEQFRELRQSWENSSLEKHYTAIFCDALFITVRRGESYSREGVFIAFGVREDGRREILAIENNPTESAENGKDFLKKVRERGVKTTDIIIVDGLPGMENVVHELFPSAKFQKCVVHKQRQILNKTRPKDKTEMAKDLSFVFDHFGETATKEDALHRLDAFCQKWKKTYPNIERFFGEGIREYYFTYIDFPISLRRMIYTTNAIENLNRIIRKATKNKLSFESPETLLDFVFIVVKEFEDSNWMKYPISAFQNYSDTRTQFC